MSLRSSGLLADEIARIRTALVEAGLVGGEAGRDAA
jgi:hypothetical protein